MKKILFCLPFFAFSVIATAQQKNEADQDKLQSQPATPPQQATSVSTQPVENATHTNPKSRSDNEIKAEKRAKDKSQSQSQTKTQPQGLPPNLNDTVNSPKTTKKIIVQ